MDPKYPDRQRVQSIASRKLSELGRPIRNKPPLITTKPIWAGMIALVVIGAVAAGVILASRGNQQPNPTLTAPASKDSPVVPATTTAPTETNTPRPSTSIPATVAPTDPTVYDDFDNTIYDGKFNSALWGADTSAGKIAQGNGALSIQLDQYNERDIGLDSSQSYKPAHPIFVESKMMLDTTSRKDAVIYVTFTTSDGGSACAIVMKNINGDQVVRCWSSYFGAAQRSYEKGISPGTWHVLKIEIYPDTMTFDYLVDGERIGSYIPRDPDKLKKISYSPAVHVNSGTDPNPSVTGYVDYVRTGLISFVWDFDDDTQGWGVDPSHAITKPQSLDGNLIFKITGFDPYMYSPYPLKMDASATPVITIRMRCIHGPTSDWNIYFETNKDREGDEKKRVSFNIKNSTSFETYNILMSTNPAWKDIITVLRLDPPDSSGDVQLEIDYISVHAP